MNKTLLFLLAILFHFSGGAQWHDAHSHFSGYPEIQVVSPHRSAVANYNTQHPEIEVLDNLLPNRLQSITMSDEAGNLIFYTNGKKIYNSQHVLMENGDDINFGEVADDPDWQTWGYPVAFASLCIPVNDNIYYYIHARIINECHPIVAGDLLYTIIDMNANGGLGKVLEKNQLIADCSNNNWSAVSATRHANGRDWWVIAAVYNLNQYLRFRVNASGISDPEYIMIDDAQGDWGNGQSFFSADGSKYIDCRHARSARVYDFDRCSGSLGGYQEFGTKSNSGFGLGIGAAYSPNARYVYLSSPQEIVQVDLDSPNIAEELDTVAVFDGFYDENINRLCYFGMMQLMPNGVIYNSNFPAGQTRYLHQIRFPNRKRAACRPMQHSIRTPLTINTITYSPNYRLGPLDGSACDTLGINNLPLAHFRWDVEDTLTPLSVTFSDLSAYEPATWFWDFGDGTISQDTSPVHLFPAPGTYTVCLRVCNDYACDTLCREVTVGASGTTETAADPAGYHLYPNPTSSSFTLRKTSGFFTGGEPVVLYNSTGQVLATRQPARGETSLVFGVESYPPGVYWLRVEGVVIKVLRMAGF